MYLYWFLYWFSILFAIFLWGQIWHRYRNLSWLFFFLFVFFASIWNGLYFLFFSGITNPDALLYITRIAFATWIISVYNLLFFVYFFQNKTKKVSLTKILKIISIFLWIIIFFVFTPYIISDIHFSETDKVYREIYGSVFLLVPITYIFFITLFTYFSYKKVFENNGLDRIRIRNIVIATYTWLLLLITLQVFLPLLWIWILEKEIIFIYLTFIVFLHYTITRYYFSSIGYGIAKLIIFLISFWLVMVIMGILELSLKEIHVWSINNYWLVDNFTEFIIKFLIGLTVYQIIYTYLRRQFLGVIWQAQLHATMQSLQKRISQITNIENLQKELRICMNNVFKTSSCELLLIPEIEKRIQLNNFFSIPGNTIFINDFVFIEEHKNSIDISKIGNEVFKNDFLILPLHSTNGHIIGLLKFWPKPLGDFYTKIEIDEIQSFSFFLEIHLKYIRTYVTIEELSTNLDKKVDEKTIEYNNIINRQKEFISIISHEIRSPIGSAIFQSDSIIDDLDSDTIKPEKLKEELSILNKQLVRTGGLISKLFSVQYYDTHSVNLFRENIEFGKFLEYEVELFSHVHSWVSFQSKIKIYDSWLLIKSRFNRSSIIFSIML